jgi:streptogramin lyase
VASPAQAVRITEYSDGLGAHGIAAGPDGNIWGAEMVRDEGKLLTRYLRVDPAGPTLLSRFDHPGTLSNDIVRAGGGVYAADRVTLSDAVIAQVTPDRLIRLTAPGAMPLQTGFAGAPDGGVWVGRTFDYLAGPNQKPLVSRFNPATRTFGNYPLPNGVRYTIAVGPDGSVWFDELASNRQIPGTFVFEPTYRINRLSPSTGEMTSVNLGSNTSVTKGTVARDGAYWFVGRYAQNSNYLIGRVSPDGRSVTQRDPPFEVGFMLSITQGPDGALYATSRTGLVRIDPATFAMQQIPYPTGAEKGGLIGRTAVIGNDIWTGTEDNLVRVEVDKNGVATGDIGAALSVGLTAAIDCTTACAATADVTTSTRARVATAARRRRSLRLGRKKFKFPAAHRGVELVRLARSRRVRRYLRTHRKLTVRVRVRVREGGRTRTSVRRIVLRKRGIKKPRRRR